VFETAAALLDANKEKISLEARLRDMSKKLKTAKQSLISQKAEASKFRIQADLDIKSWSVELASVKKQLEETLAAQEDRERERDKRVDEALEVTSRLLDHSIESNNACRKAEKLCEELKLKNRLHSSLPVFSFYDTRDSESYECGSKRF